MSVCGERETVTSHSGVYSASEIVLIAAFLQTHTRIITVSVTRPCSPPRAWTDGKTKDIINCLYIHSESWSSRLWKGALHFDVACGVRPITMHCASWPIRAHCAFVKERLCINRSVWERRGIEDLQYVQYWKIMCFLNIKACQHILLHQKHKIMIFKKASYDPFKTWITILLVWSITLNCQGLHWGYSLISHPINSEGGCIDYLVNEGT